MIAACFPLFIHFLFYRFWFLLLFSFCCCFYCFSLPEDDESLKATTCEDENMTRGNDGEACGTTQVPLTGTEVVHILARKDSLEFDLYYLREVEGECPRCAVVRPSSSRR